MDRSYVMERKQFPYHVVLNQTALRGINVMSAQTPKGSAWDFLWECVELGPN